MLTAAVVADACRVKYAVNTETGKAVAIKILDKEKIQKQNMGAQIKKEVRRGNSGSVWVDVVGRVVPADDGVGVPPCSFPPRSVRFLS